MLLCLQDANSMVLLASSKLSALKSLTILSMNEEDVFGLEYDPDLFNIVVVLDFNMGAMESKSLNIFNSKLVFVSPETVTDADYVVILGAIGHEKSRNTLMRLLPKLKLC
ncbi:puromycin-sensitive aminopeptidase-like [Camellia sinensis]|uniref:puromycin-sensitive aminopeptidase-like n=1 Tax=Camellia sinensis TaxID=4442 RepID=UPI001035F7F5|nr:puromycin-sensitive aminopeptidase-like [Camellia sinensis]